MPVKTVLVIDDSPTERFYVTEILQSQGYEVYTSDNGTDGLAAAETLQPDLILMDVVMPDVNGFQATRTLNRNEKTCHIPVIICTTKDQESDKVWGLRQGAVDYMVKPLDPEALIARVQSIP